MRTAWILDSNQHLEATKIGKTISKRHDDDDDILNDNGDYKHDSSDYDDDR